MTAEQLEHSPYEILVKLRDAEPVSWIPALNGWLVTGRDEAITAMRDPDRFTVDDPRFSTAAVLGDSMLNLEGPEHLRHRTAFAEFFRPRAVREGMGEWLALEARGLLRPFVGASEIEFRSALAGPLAVNSIGRFLGLKDAESDEVLGWYGAISAAIEGVALGEPVPAAGNVAVATIHERVAATVSDQRHASVVGIIADEGILAAHEIAPATAVVMFGAIETVEGMIANALWHLLSNPAALAKVRKHRKLLPAAIEESLRLEPAAAVVDRYTTTEVEMGEVTIPAGDLVTLSLLAANRDPAVFPEPDTYDIDRPNLKQHLTFIQGPHACIGLHLARAEAMAALTAVLDLFPNLELVPERSSAPAGLIFRKAASVVAAIQ